MKDYIVYNSTTGEIYKDYDSKRGATAASNRLNACRTPEYVACTYLDYRGNVLGETKTVKNLMTGKDVVIPVNTPRCCDPSTELYWTM